MNRRLLGLLLIVASVLGYGTFPIFIKFVYAEGMRPLDLVFWRFVVAVGFIWLAAPLWWKQAGIAKLRGPRLIDPLWLGWIFAIPAILAALALDRVSASTYTVIIYTYPVMVALLSLALGRRLAWNGWLAVSLATLGCLLTIGGRLEVTSPLDVLLPLVNALFICVFLIIGEIKADSVRGLSFSILNITSTLVFVAPVALTLGIAPPPTPTAWLLMLIIGVFCTVMPITTLMNGVTLLGASEAAIVSTLEPVLTVVLAVLILGEVLGPLQMVGAALILLSLVLLQLPGLIRRQAGATTPADQPSA